MNPLSYENYVYRKTGAIPIKELSEKEKKAWQEYLVTWLADNTNIQVVHRDSK